MGEDSGKLSQRGMNKKSASALVWASVITSAIGMLVLSPAAGFVLYVVAILLSIVPILSGQRVTRIAAAVAFIISLTFAYQGYPAFEKERDAYRKRTEARSIKVPAQATVEPQDKK
jgi:hypothetical protein